MLSYTEGNPKVRIVFSFTEYFIPEAATLVHPVLFGQPFDGPMAGHGPGSAGPLRPARLGLEAEPGRHPGGLEPSGVVPPR